MNQSDRPQLDNLTALRFFAALSVFLLHIGALGINVAQHVWNMSLGWTVSFFFVLSGFVLAYSYNGKINSAKTALLFMLRRLAKLWPLHVTCGLIAAMAVSSVGSFENYYLFATLQHAWIPTYVKAYFLNAPSWSISVELAFYILFPLFIILPTRRLALLFAAWTAVVLGVILVATIFPAAIPFTPLAPGEWYVDGVTAPSFANLFPPMRVPEFLSGIVIFRLLNHFRIPDRWVALSQLAILGLVAAYLPWHYTITISLHYYVSGVAGASYDTHGVFPLFAALIFVFAHQTGRLSALLSNQVLVYLGRTSFAFYLIHQIIINYMVRTGVFQDLDTGFVFGFALLASLVGASLLHHLVELPTYRWAGRRLDSWRRSRQSADPLPFHRTAGSVQRFNAST